MKSPSTSAPSGEKNYTSLVSEWERKVVEKRGEIAWSGVRGKNRSSRQGTGPKVLLGRKTRNASEKRGEDAPRQEKKKSICLNISWVGEEIVFTSKGENPRVAKEKGKPARGQKGEKKKKRRL